MTTLKLLYSKYHEHRLTALIILTYTMKISTQIEQEKIVKFYLNNIKYINGWDLVDLSAYNIVGLYLLDKPDKRNILYDLANSYVLWGKRISIVSTWIFINNNQFDDTLNISKILLKSEHDLIHKAVGWMLREIGKRNFDVEYNFLSENYKLMPRTMLRYSIERFPEDLRKQILKGELLTT